MTADEIHDEATAILTHHIEVKNMRKTPERFAILDIVLSMDGHHSVEQIQQLMPDNFPVSRPTVYSTMEMLEELKIVMGHQLGPTRVYERAIGRKPHHHYVCTNCGEITDLEDKKIDYILSIAKTPRFSKDISIAYLFGLCSKCKAVINKRKRKEERERIANMSREERRFMQIDKDLAKMAAELAKVGIGKKK